MPRLLSYDGIPETDARIAKAIAKKCIDLNKNDHDVCKAICMPLSTYRKKKKTPTDYRVEDLVKITKYLRFNHNDFLSMLGKDML